MISIKCFTFVISSAGTIGFLWHVNFEFKYAISSLINLASLAETLWRKIEINCFFHVVMYYPDTKIHLDSLRIIQDMLIERKVFIMMTLTRIINDIRNLQQSVIHWKSKPFTISPSGPLLVPFRINFISYIVFSI